MVSYDISGLSKSRDSENVMREYALMRFLAQFTFLGSFCKLRIFKCTFV